VEVEGDVAGEDKEIGGGFGEEFDGVGAERIGSDVEVGGFEGDLDFAEAGDFVGAGVGSETGGIHFDEGMFDGLMTGPAVFLGDGAIDFFGELAAGIGVGHDGETLAIIAIRKKIAAETFVGAAVAEAGFAARGFETEAEPPRAYLGREHLASHGLRKNFGRFSGVFVLNFDSHASEVGGSSP